LQALLGTLPTSLLLARMFACLFVGVRARLVAYLLAGLLADVLACLLAWEMHD